MNKRQRKKRRMKYIAMNDYPQEPFSEYQCLYCGWDSENVLGDEEAWENGTVHMKDRRHFFNGDYSGNEWTEEYKCPICGTRFELETSDV